MPNDLDEFLFEHYKQEYNFQRERTDTIRDRVSFVVGFLTVLGGILSYFVSEFPHAWHCGRTLFFYVPLAVAVPLFITSTAVVLWVVGGNFLYQAIPSNPQLQKFCDDLVVWSAAGGRPADIVPTIKRSLVTAYRDGSHHNFLVNRKRTDRLLLATRLVVVAFIFSAAMLPSYIFEKSQQEKEPIFVRLVSPSEQQPQIRSLMGDTNQPASPAPASTAPATPAPSATPGTAQSAPALAPAMPVFPPNQLLSEGAVRMETKPAPLTPPKKSE
jgi:hypothetical protein